jgi:hypothetical protein
VCAILNAIVYLKGRRMTCIATHDTTYAKAMRQMKIQNLQYVRHMVIKMRNTSSSPPLNIALIDFMSRVMAYFHVFYCIVIFRIVCSFKYLIYPQEQHFAFKNGTNRRTYYQPKII